MSKPVPENTTAAPVAISTTDTPPSRKGVRKAWMLAVLIAAGLAASAATRADEDAERENLARIANEIARLEMMVKEATTSAPTGQRVKFRYDWLQRDLQLVREGVEQHVDAPRQPRPVAPLRGDYRQ